MFANLTRWAQVGSPRDLTWDEIMGIFNTLPWRIVETRHPDLGKGRIGFAVLDRDRETGRQWVMVVLERAAARPHRHVGGEMIFTLGGDLEDVSDTGERITLNSGSVIMHGPDSVHQPFAPVWWWGVYFQPLGNVEVAD